MSKVFVVTTQHAEHTSKVAFTLYETAVRHVSVFIRSYAEAFGAEDLEDVIGEDLFEAIGVWSDLTGGSIDIEEVELVEGSGRNPRVRSVPAEELSLDSLRAQDYVDEPGRHSTMAYRYLARRPLDHPAAPDVLKALRLLAAHCLSTAVDKGWWEKYGTEMPAADPAWLPEIMASKLALVQSELSEAIEEIRSNDDYGMTPYFGDDILLVPGEEPPPGEKPEGLGVELADAVIRIFDLSAWLGIDIGELIMWKMKYNNTRPHKHGGKSI